MTASTIATQQSSDSKVYRACLFCVVLGWTWLVPVVAWETRDRAIVDGSGEWPIAVEKNQAGDRAEVFRDTNDFVYVRIKLAGGFTSFAQSNCATFQIDNRQPVHHYGIGEFCEVSTKDMTMLLGDVVDNLIISLPLHRLMNGNQVAFRFVTSSGEYHQSVFSLRGSKQVLTQALGNDVRVEPKIADGSQTDGEN